MTSAKVDATAPNIQALDLSVAGSLQAFTIVGMANSASANIANIVVIQALLDQ